MKIITGALGVWLVKVVATLHGKPHDKITIAEKSKAGAILFLFIVFALSATSIGSGKIKTGGLKADLINGVVIPPPAVVTNSIETTNLTSATFSVSSANANTTQSGSGVNVLFLLRVVNSGAPTTAWNWRAWVVLPGGSKIESTIPGIVGVHATQINTPVGIYTADMENNLLHALSSHPLDTGFPIMGWLVVHVNGLDAPPLGAHFIITFDDVFGRTTKVEDVWDAKSN